MPDLIIKPTATSGNKLILKDQAGGAVLTTADSGATIANATLTTPTIANMANCTFPDGHVLQVVRNDIFSYVTSSGSTEAWETDAKDLHITVTAGNMVVAWIGGGMLNAETGVEGYRTAIRFSENSGSANQDKWTTTHIGGNFTPDLYHPMMVISASVIAAHTGEMLIKRGTDNSGSSNTSWSSDDNSSYGRVHYLAMEIQQ